LKTNHPTKAPIAQYIVLLPIVIVLESKAFPKSHRKASTMITSCIRALVSLVVFAVAFSQSKAFPSTQGPATPVARRADLKSLPGSNLNLNPNPGAQSSAIQMSQGVQSEAQEKAEKNVNKPVDGEGETENTSERSLSAGIFLSAVVAATASAKAGMIRGPLLATGEFGAYTDSMILRDVGSATLTAALGYVLVKIIILGYNQELYNSNVSRKLTHTLSAPLFILFFPIFSEADGARFFAGAVAFVNSIRLYRAGTGRNSNLARTISRSGDASEVLEGPFIYVCQLLLFVLAFWRSSMVGIVAMSTLAAGDGMADLIGRRFGKGNKWFFSESKSIAGTAGFAVASSLTSIGLVNWLSTTGCLQYSLSPMDLALRIIAISVVCAIVELFPVVDDNYSVPITAAALTAWLLY
jgi:phytol kinase